MKALHRLFSYAIVAGLAGVAVYFWQRPESALKLRDPVPTLLPVSLASKSPEPEIHFPVPGDGGRWPKGASAIDAASRVLPGLDESDSTVQEALARIFGPNLSLFYAKDFVRRIVATIDNLTEQKQSSSRFLAVKSPEGILQASKIGGGQFLISPANADRYTPYVSLLAAVDLKKLIAAYVQYYPLFQSAFSDLGVQGYFNDRLVQVIDKLLSTPDVSEPIRLVKAVVSYRFADPKLEELSSGQKLLIRMGPDNESAVKARLRLLRAQLTNLPPASGT